MTINAFVADFTKGVFGFQRPEINGKGQPINVQALDFGWYKEWKAIKDNWIEFEDDNEPAAVVAWDSRERLSVLISNAKATTLEGALAQVSWFEDDFGYLLEDMLGANFQNSLPNIRASLEGLVP